MLEQIFTWNFEVKVLHNLNFNHQSLDQSLKIDDVIYKRPQHKETMTAL